MEFKYLKNHTLNTLNSVQPIICDCCGTKDICHLPFYGGLNLNNGDEFFEKICYQCIYSGKLIKTETILCGINQMALFESLKNQYPHKNYNELVQLKSEIQPNLESKTPQIKTFNEYWPIIGEDFGQFIGFASQALLTSLTKGEGLAFFDKYRNPLVGYYSWKELPKNIINGIHEALELGDVLHVFRGVSSEEYCIL